nr:MAK10-like protein [Tanacetum cinerariifolium]
MGDANLIRTLGDYSKPSHEGYKNTIELPVGNNVIPLRSDTIQLAMPGRQLGALLQTQGENLKSKTTEDIISNKSFMEVLVLNHYVLVKKVLDYSKPSYEGYMITIELPVGNNVVPLRSDTIQLVQNRCKFHRLRRTIDQSAGGKLRDRNAKESWALLEDLALYDNESRNDPRDFTKLVKAIALPQDVPSTYDHRLIELENQVQRLMEAHFALTQLTQVNNITTPCEICSGPHDTQYCMEDPEQAFVEYTSSRNSMASENITSINHIEREELRRKRIKIPSKLFSLKYLFPASIIELNKNLSASKRVHFVNSIVILNKESKAEERETTTDITPKHSHNITKEANEEVKDVIDEEEREQLMRKLKKYSKIKEEEDENGEYFNSFPTMKELTHHEWLLKDPRPPWVKVRIRAGSLNNIEISCMIGHFFERHAYIDLESPINIMFRRQYNQIMTYGLGSRQKPLNLNTISNFVGRVRSLKIFIGSFAYECDSMILEDSTNIINRNLGELTFGRPFIDESGLVYNREEGTIIFKHDEEKITFKCLTPWRYLSKHDLWV